MNSAGMKMNDVILITGPSGSGKTSLAEFIREQCNSYAVVSEDQFWMELKANDPLNEWRTLEEEVIIQNQVVTNVKQQFKDGKSVVLEFILYCDPPRPLLAYQEALREFASNLTTVVLKPSVDAILTRKSIRGRANEQDTAAEASIAVSQLNCLDSPYIKREWIVENEDLSVSETFELLLRMNRHIFEQGEK